MRPGPRSPRMSVNKLIILGALCLLGVGVASGQTPAASQRALLDRYCVGCHSQKLRTGGLVLEKLDAAHPADQTETWEKVIRKVRAGLMPPAGLPRPDA